MRYAIIALYFCALASCGGAASHEEPSYRSPETAAGAVAASCDSVELASNVARGTCVSLSLRAPGLSAEKEFRVSARGPERWDAEISFRVSDQSGPICAGTFTENATAACGRFLFSDGDELSIDFSVDPIGPSGVSLWFEQVD